MGKSSMLSLQRRMSFRLRHCLKLGVICLLIFWAFTGEVKADARATNSREIPYCRPRRISQKIAAFRADQTLTDGSRNERLGTRSEFLDLKIDSCGATRMAHAA
jgi:hypothetical protein